MEIKALYDIFRQSSGVNTDSRTIRSGELFFALKGENFDGNSYALKALEAGAVAAVVNDTLEDEDPRLIKVPDSLSTLKELAAYHRQNVLGDKHLPVIGLTGTN
ncbi:MAG: UDP-N-acetylmuramoyl-tripeptide--D-alanyl-D-alanine ligase, partial [Bacteroidales bacterium]|nr:UDP-N-acetylmuramoyl-tripeptide--D-alanyl-D-alanine ligase [Bacteroidales bacterium]